MPTFYDPIELKDIDINDPAANFYIIKLPDNSYKFCATTQNLDSPFMHWGDPTTRIKHYYPITREQLNGSNVEVLFPNNEIRNAPMTIEDLQLIFHFNPVEQQQRVFGLPVTPPQINSDITWETIFPEWNMENHEQWNTWILRAISNMSDQGVQLISILEDDDLMDVQAEQNLIPFLLSIRNNDIPLQALVNVGPAELVMLIRTYNKISPDIIRGTYALGEYINLLQEFYMYSNTHLDQNAQIMMSSFVRGNHQVVIAQNFIEGIRTGLLNYAQLFDAIFDSHEDIEPHSGIPTVHEYSPEKMFLCKACMPAMLDGYFSFEDLDSLSMRQIQLIAQEGPLNAICSGQTDFETLKNLPEAELEHAIETNQYPDSQNRLRY